MLRNLQKFWPRGFQIASSEILPWGCQCVSRDRLKLGEGKTDHDAVCPAAAAADGVKVAALSIFEVVDVVMICRFTDRIISDTSFKSR